MILLSLLAQAVTIPPSTSSGTSYNPALYPLFSYKDYPKEALRKGWQGDVIFDVTVGTNGRIVACTILQSSGYKILDDTTCKIASERARFIPAKDVNGNPVESHFQKMRISWRIAN